VRQRRRRLLAFVVVASVTALSLVAGAQQRKPGAAAAAAPAAKRPPVPARGATKPSSTDEDGGALATKDERPPPSNARDAGGSGVESSKTLDGGTRVFRFGEVEVEGRLKSPQIVYFLRRVRAEFAAGDLGHRTFLRELDETRNEPGF
jgi:hypothetical protein